MAKKRDAYRYFLVIGNVMLSYSALRQSVASVDIYSSDKLLKYTVDMRVLPSYFIKCYLVAASKAIFILICFPFPIEK